MNDIDAAVPYAELSIKRWLALAVILAGTFMVTLDFFIVNVAIPSMQNDLHAGTAAIEWIVAGYGLAYAALLITGGRLGDLYGRRAIFNYGLAIFSLASAACGVAPNAAILVIARAMQGVGAALLAPQVLAIVGTLYTGANRARAFAAYGAVLGLSSACGQVIGGLLIRADALGLGWRACFLVNVPIGLAAWALTGVVVPDIQTRSRSSLDMRGAALVAAAIGAVLFALIEGREQNWPLWTWLCIVASAVLLARFVLHQRQRTALCLAPLIDPALFDVRRFRIGLLAVLVLFGGVASFFFVLALYLQRGRGLGPLPSGLVFTALALPFTATSLNAGRIGRWLGRPPLVPGAIGMAAGLVALRLAIGWEGTGGPLLPMLGALVIDGAGMGLVMAPLVAAVLAGLPARHAGAAAGVLATAQQLANALGVAAVGVAFFGMLGGGYGGAFAVSLDWLVVLALGLAALVWRLE
ncbi:MAG TPA: MFS transporter [Acetobacteraceae bacterium]|jgi:EmrB/QacA subfamily drug resistance transporter